MGAGTKGTGATGKGTDEESKPIPADPGECGVGVVAGAWQQQAASEQEPACGRGECGRGGLCVPVRELSVWGRVWWRGVLVRLRSRRGRAAGVGARRGLCEGM